MNPADSGGVFVVTAQQCAQQRLAARQQAALAAGLQLRLQGCLNRSIGLDAGVVRYVQLHWDLHRHAAAVARFQVQLQAL